MGVDERLLCADGLSHALAKRQGPLWHSAKFFWRNLEGLLLRDEMRLAEERADCHDPFKGLQSEVQMNSDQHCEHAKDQRARRRRHRSEERAD